MSTWLLAIILLVAMILSFGLGFWLFIPFLLVGFFVLVIRSWTRRSVRRAV